MFDIDRLPTIIKSVRESTDSVLELAYSGTDPAKIGVWVGAFMLFLLFSYICKSKGEKSQQLSMTGRALSLYKGEASLKKKKRNRVISKSLS